MFAFALIHLKICGSVIETMDLDVERYTLVNRDIMFVDFVVLEIALIESFTANWVPVNVLVAIIMDSKRNTRSWGVLEVRCLDDS